MILRRLVSCFALALLVNASAADPTPRRPNILWLAGENLAHDRKIAMRLAERIDAAKTRLDSAFCALQRKHAK